jgi:hypothetical protein
MKWKRINKSDWRKRKEAYEADMKRRDEAGSFDYSILTYYANRTMDSIMKESYESFFGSFGKKKAKKVLTLR